MLKARSQHANNEHEISTPNTNKQSCMRETRATDHEKDGLIVPNLQKAPDMFSKVYGAKAPRSPDAIVYDIMLYYVILNQNIIRCVYVVLSFGTGDDPVGNPHRAQNCQCEFFELILLLK